MVTGGKVVRYDLDNKTCSPLLQVEFCEIVGVFCLSADVLAAVVYESDRFVVQSSRILYLKVPNRFKSPVGFWYRFDKHLGPITQTRNVCFEVGEQKCKYQKGSGPHMWNGKLYFLNDERRIIVAYPRNGKIIETELPNLPQRITGFTINGSAIDYAIQESQERRLYSLHLRKHLLRMNTKSIRHIHTSRHRPADMHVSHDGMTTSTWRVYGVYGTVAGMAIMMVKQNDACMMCTSEGEVVKVSVKHEDDDKRVFKKWFAAKMCR